MNAVADDVAGRVRPEQRTRWLTGVQPRLRFGIAFGVFLVAYFFAYRFGMSFGEATASPFWFPDPVLLCALLLNRPKRWWVFVAATLPIRVLTAPGDLPLWFLMSVFAIDGARAVATAAILRRFLRNPTRLETVREFAIFFIFAVTLMPAIGALGGAAARHALGFEFWTTWHQWFMGDALAHVVITPAILYWIVGLPTVLHRPERKRMVEGLLVTVGLLVTGYFAFESESHGVAIAEPLFYAPVPFLFWAAIRFGMFGASGAVVLIAVMATEAAIAGHGPFAGDTPQDTALLLQNFLLWRAAPLYLVAILISQKNAIERSLRKSEALFRNMADFAPALIWMSGPDKGCTYVNQRWLEFTGLTTADALENRWAECVHPDDRERCWLAYDNAFDARAPVTLEYQLRRRDGQYRLLLTHSIPRVTPEGEFLGYIGSGIDITDRKLAEAELHRQRMELTHAGRVSTMGQLSAALAHELNQPLAAILRNAEAGEMILQRQPLDQEEIRAILADIRQDDQRAGAVIDRMRSLLRRRDFEFESLDLWQLIEQVAGLVRTDMSTRRVALSLNVPRGLPQVRGDRVHLQQVVLNLLVNGADAMNAVPAEQRRLTISAQLNDEHTLEVIVRDHGCGIPDELLRQVFEPFFTTKGSGMGLGLAICRTIIEAHGGRIWATNAGDGGASFHFTLMRSHRGHL